MQFLKSFYRLISLKIRVKYFIPSLILFIIAVRLLGIFDYIRESSYLYEFKYPLEGNIHLWVSQLKSGEKPTVKVINNHNYIITKSAKGKCLDDDGAHYIRPRVVYIVKSALNHFDKRKSIRRTWGYEKRFSDVKIRTVFLLGRDENFSADLQASIEEEAQQNGDIVQGDFIDTYFNNTLKTMMGMRWANEHCPTSKFYFFVDDDYYVSTRNVLRFLRNPVNYPGYLEEPILDFDEENFAKNQGRKLQQLVEYELPEDVMLFAGYLFPNSKPKRFPLSKWYLSLDEYPYDRFPPYITAGAYVLSRKALMDMYYASYFIQRFKFDDIYLGIIAKKLGIEPFYAANFEMYRNSYKTRDFQYLIASHGFSDPAELERVWNDQKMAGNA